MIDSHCHIGFDELKQDVHAIVDRAKANGVNKILTVGCGLEALNDLHQVLNSFDCVYGAIGIHPNDKNNSISIDTLSKALKSHQKIIAVGETGLDYYYNDVPKEVQMRNFQIHIDTACLLGLPLIIHTRDAEEDTIRLLKETKKSSLLKGVFHCFSGSKKLADFAEEIGFYLSASGIITFKKNSNNEKKQSELLDIFSKYPINKLLVETDAPYLAPVPKRGKINEPAFISHTLDKLAELRGITSEEMDRITTENFYHLFEGLIHEN